MKEDNVKVAKMFQLFALNGDLGKYSTESYHVIVIML
jgi:hypothetical protein